jgi:hypothetical protein
MLPSFAIVSVERGGTTSLYRWLCQHPCVGEAVRKEVHYFDMNFARGERWYRAHFPLRAEAALRRVLRRRPFVAAEASPYYLYHPHVPARLSRVLPRARFVALVRNPVERAWSHYHMNRRQGEEAFSFEDAIAREGERLAGEEERLRLDEGFWSHSHYRYGYLARGLYAERLEEWGKRFGPERLLVVSSEELYADPEGTLARVVAWLGLPAWSPEELPAYNQKPYPGLDPEVRRRLADFFAPHNQRLYALLGRDLGWS